MIGLVSQIPTQSFNREMLEITDRFNPKPEQSLPSYFANAPNAPGRITSNMRKNSGFHVVANGPPGIAPGQQGAHEVRLIKDGARVHMQVDGRVVVDFLDDGKRYGAVLGAGKIGFRQMSPTVARYRRFRVQALAPPQ